MTFELPYTCTKANSFESVCTFTCQTGINEVVCRKVDFKVLDFLYVKGDWVIEKEECRRMIEYYCILIFSENTVNFLMFYVEALCPAIPEATNLKIDCSNSNSYVSVCNFACDKGTKLSHEEPMICKDVDSSENGVWSGDPPYCYGLYRSTNPCDSISVTQRTNFHFYHDTKCTP